ncbi:MAG: tRNA (guanosine(46)-N7)-methyltransferase TrmB [Erysipelotrichaceae bacterium]
MRMRKKPYRDTVLNDRIDVIVKEPQLVKGCWKELLDSDILHVEIGSGKGDYWIKMSELYPSEGFVGIEKNLDVAARAVNKTSVNQLPKSRFIALDSKDISSWFDLGEIDVIHLNFSDPWLKSGYKKRRLTHSNFLQMYYDLLNVDGRIIMKTDNKDLFEFSLLEFATQPFELVDVSVDFRRKENDDVISEYEQKFMDLGQVIYRGIWRKK